MDQGSSDNIFERQQMSTSQVRVRKPPTRIQKLAPTCLELRHNNDSPLVAIPLLSPLVMSPRQEAAEEFRFPTKICSGNDMSIDDKAFMQPGAEESSSLFDCFRSKCALINNAQ
ncbi:hypothetical protein ACFE04_013834 [Oxalis oulophora]